MNHIVRNYGDEPNPRKVAAEEVADVDVRAGRVARYRDGCELSLDPGEDAPDTCPGEGCDATLAGVLVPDGGDKTLDGEAHALAQEMGQVVNRHPELLRAAPQYVAAQLLGAADQVVEKHGLDVTVSEQSGERPIWVVEFHPPERCRIIDPVGEALGAPRTEDGLIDENALEVEGVRDDVEAVEPYEGEKA